MTLHKFKSPFTMAVAGIILATALVFLSAGTLSAAGGHENPSMEGKQAAGMDHQKMAGGFKQPITAEGVTAEFQIMSLAQMNMPDAEGATHHIMVKFMDAASGEQIKQAVGRVKVISPSKNETVVDLKDYNGTYAANVTFDDPGRYGIICLVKVGGKKPLYKFWYPHQ